MKKLLLVTLIISSLLFGCKKEKTPAPIVIEQRYEAFKLGDIVRWTSSNNPTPNNKMRVISVQYNNPEKPINATILDTVDGKTTYYVACIDLTLWK